MARTREGVSTHIVTLDEVRSIERAQYSMLKDGIIDMNGNKVEQALATAISVISIVASIVGKVPTPLGVAVSVVSLALGMSESEKEYVESISGDGRDWLLEVAKFMNKNPQYDIIEFDFPYLEYYDLKGHDEKFKFVTGTGLIKRVHSGNSWIIL